jgi:hypothetical protein
METCFLGSILPTKTLRSERFSAKSENFEPTNYLWKIQKNIHLFISDFGEPRLSENPKMSVNGVLHENS